MRKIKLSCSRPGLLLPKSALVNMLLALSSAEFFIRMSLKRWVFLQADWVYDLDAHEQLKNEFLIVENASRDS